jgi:hypothetical protein
LESPLSLFQENSVVIISNKANLLGLLVSTVIKCK